MAKPRQEYKDTFPKLLIDHMAKGLSFESFGGLLYELNEVEWPVSWTILQAWEKEYPDFKSAREGGDSSCRLFWERKGIEGCFSETSSDKDGNYYQKSLNSAAWTANMRNRFGWTGTAKELVIKTSGSKLVIKQKNK